MPTDVPVQEPAITSPDPRADRPDVLAGPGDLAELVTASSLRHVHMLAWRDLADVEAGGSEVHMDKVAARFAAAGLDVTVRTSYAKGQPVRDRRNGYRVVRRAGRYTVFPRAITSELARRTGPIDAVVEAWNGVPFFTPLWFPGPRAVLIHHVHRDMWAEVIEGRVASLGRALELRVAPPAYRRSAIVALSASTRAEVIDVLGLPAENITVVPPGIDPRFGPGGRRSDHPLVVAVGRLMPTKRFDVLIRLAAEVKARHPGLELVIAGEGYERSRLEAMVAELDAAEWIRLPGRVSNEELVHLYRRAWVVAATSMAEGWGMTLTEAAACGTPVVATRISGHVDAVEDGTGGLLGDDERELVGHLDAVLGDADLRHRLSEGARKHAAGLTWDATAWGVFRPLAAQALARPGRARR